MKAGLALVLLGVVACTPARRHATVDVTSGRAIRLGPAAMPDGKTFSGRYQSPQLGELQLEQRGEQLFGTYQNELFGCRLSGRIHGKRVENHVEFAFTESYTFCANARKLSGTGFVFYVEPGPSTPMVRLFGERFLGARVSPARRPRRSRPALGAFSAVLVPGSEPSSHGRHAARLDHP